MSSAYLWVKAFPIVFVASCFAGLFHLPRLFVNLALVPGGVGHHHACRVLLRRFEPAGNRRRHTWYGILDEASVLPCAATVVLVVVKPF